MMDWLLVLGAIGVCALLHALVESQDPPPAAAPRRNYVLRTAVGDDVLAPAGPRVGATRLDNVDAQTLRDLALARRLFGATAGTVVTIRPEVRDGRQ